MKIRKNYESTDDFPGLHCKDKSLTLQSEAESCDINYILKRVEQGGQIESNPNTPRYGDFSQHGDPANYIHALTAVSEAQEAFSQLPASLRARFLNDPAKLLEFVSDDENRPEAERLGLVAKKPENSSASPDLPKGEPNPAPKGGQ